MSLLEVLAAEASHRWESLLTGAKRMFVLYRAQTVTHFIYDEEYHVVYEAHGRSTADSIFYGTPRSSQALSGASRQTQSMNTPDRLSFLANSRVSNLRF